MKYNANITSLFGLSSLFGLYCAQGVPLGLAIFALPGILRSLGADMRLIGLVGLSMLPWAFKMLWASFIENHKPWFFRGLPTGLAWIQFCKVCSLIAMTLLWFFAPETQVLALLLLVTLINFFYASQDVAVDALAVRVFAGSRHVRVNVSQIAGFSLGMLLGGVVSLYVFSVWGWSVTVWWFLLLQGLCHLPFMFHLGRFTAENKLPVIPGSASLWKIFRRKGWVPIVVMAVVFKFASTMGAALVSPLLVDMGVSLEQIALLAGGVLIISYIVGAILSGVLHRWFSSPQLTIFGLLGSMLCWLGMTLSLSFSAHNSLPVFVFFILEGFFFNLCCVSIFAWFMCWSEGDEDQGIVQPGTDFTLLQCCEVLGGSIAMVLSGTLAYYLGFTYAFGIATVCAFLVVLLTLYCFRRSQSAYAGFQKDRHTVEIG
ncbi:MFS transporter [Yersinia pseudotuberculosis]|uniref:Major facilitator superfamily MFS_1 n=1 Tax=Yersinia pseudotuberculosis serotype O:3 (strain YPIII) TaxID=502800 RepID=A0A0H3B1P2_YERPY|nr:MFS transporter [Yersinia pseudotuberculosis]AJJ60950.1 major Facilitator Superfamily protein [Yersinia pseudotuberculosis YPIII]AYW86835.1 MFS transporter [Yersinia pseudotuberculosis]AYX01474.1 MFS transporter [Yersinia pseudotuberculosis]AZA29230.1 MFS transporter [Yersinia pseudotuberculosis]MBK1426100.1 MFS transporter [Yersinia pseudotuberculosis]